MPPRSLTARCPAKINLTLRILGRRADGFHELESWVAPVGLYDALTVTASDEFLLSVTPSQSVPTDESNLVLKAARLLAREAEGEIGAAIRLDKSIPVGAGLGGGSSNAAQTLLLLNELYQIDLSVDRLIELAAQLGSDVPLFVRSGQYVMRGRGERLERLARPWSGWAVLIMPPFEVSTAAVYRALGLEKGQSSPELPTPSMVSLRENCEAASLMTKLLNDLEPAAFKVEPRLAKIHQDLNHLDHRLVRMTGSGSVLFSLFDTQAEATDWQMRVKDRVASDTSLAVVPLIV